MSTAHSRNGGRPARRATTPTDLDQVEELVGYSEYDPTTRLSCAAWTDAEFRDCVLGEHQEQKHRTHAREPGLDAEAVALQCDRARGVRVTAGWWFICVSVVMCVFNLPAGALGLGLALFLALTGKGVGRGLGQGSGWSWGRIALVGFLLYLAVIMLLPLLLGGMAQSLSQPGGFADPYDSGGLGSQSPGSTYPSSTASSATVGFLIPFWVAFPLVILTAVSTGTWARARTNGALWELRRKGLAQRKKEMKKRAEAPAERTETDRHQNGAGTVPVGFYSSFMPFVGAGLPIRSWPVTLRLRSAGEEDDSALDNVRSNGQNKVRGNGHGPGEGARGEAAEATAKGTELVEAVYERLRSGLPELAEEGSLPAAARTRFTVADCVFLPGERTVAPGGLDGILLESESGRLRPKWVNRFVDVSHERARHFLEIGVSLWENQLLVTVFVRVTAQGGLLHIEGETLVMPPISPRYGVPAGDLPRAKDADDFLSVLWDSIRGLTGDLRDNLGEVGARARMNRRARQHDDAHTWAVHNDALFDYSPRRGVREMAAIDELEQLFQSHDLRRVTHAVQEKVLVCVGEVLRAQGYSTGEVSRIVQHIHGHNVGVGTTTFDQKTLLPEQGAAKGTNT